MVGKTLLHYRIVKKLGQGGMGEVYLAEDTRLKRQVAIKVLPESLRSSPERLARFRTEAEAAARLKHPNIAPIFALEEAVPEDDGAGGDIRHDVGVDTATSGGSQHDVRAYCNTPLQSPASPPTLFIVMEYVEGQPLYAHIPQDGMDLDTFFRIFLPLSDALAHAHTHDVTHRDIKPGNIMIAEDGTPKILDFGLARITRPEPEEAKPDAVDSQAPTMTMDPNAPLPHQNVSQTPPRSLTEGMQFMGTPAYMSPEQAQRQRVDHRTDLFSLGVVMYEALTGKRPFHGDTLESLIGHILVSEPEPVTAVKPLTPYTLWQVVRKCLQKDRDERMQTAREMHAELGHVRQEVAAGTVLVDARVIETQPESQPVPLWRQPVGIIATLVALLIGGVVVWFLKPVPEPPLRKFHMPVDLSVPSAFRGAGESYNGPVISPDGTMVAYTREGQLWLHDLTQGEARPLHGTDEAQRPFWSPDSWFVGYFVLSGDNALSLRTISVQGGPSTTVCALPTGFPRGATWNTDGEIVFGTAVVGATMGSLFTVPAFGGTPEVFLSPDTTRGQSGIIYPHFLTDGETLLYAVTTTDSVGTIVVHAGNTRTTLVRHRGETLAFPVYSPTGHIVYQRGFPISTGLWAVPFNPESGTTIGDPFLVSIEGRIPGISTDGTLVYCSNTQAGGKQQLVWVDRRGRVDETIGQPHESISGPALSPDGRQVAVSGVEDGNTDIWLHEVDRPVKIRLTWDPAYDEHPTWSPEGSQIAFHSGRSGLTDLFLLASDGSGEARPVVTGPVWDLRPDWSHDGRYLVYHTTDPTGILRDLWYVTVPEMALSDSGLVTGAPVAITQTPSYNEALPQFSPDDRYVAYQSDETGRYEIWVRSFPAGTNRILVSVDGGIHPRWGVDGDTWYLYYVEGARLMASRIDTRPRLEASLPAPLFTDKEVDVVLQQGVTPLYTPFYTVSPAGRFVMVQTVGEGVQTTTMTIVQNWIKEFKKRE